MLRKFFWQGVRTGILAFVQGLVSHPSKYKLTSPKTNSQDNIGFALAKCTAQLLHGLVLVKFTPAKIKMKKFLFTEAMKRYGKLTVGLLGVQPLC